MEKLNDGWYELTMTEDERRIIKMSLHYRINAIKHILNFNPNWEHLFSELDKTEKLLEEIEN